MEEYPHSVEGVGESELGAIILSVRAAADLLDALNGYWKDSVDRLQVGMTRTDAMRPRIVQDLALVGVETEYNFLLGFLRDLGKLNSALEEWRNSEVCVCDGVVSACCHVGCG